MANNTKIYKDKVKHTRLQKQMLNIIKENISDQTNVVGNQTLKDKLKENNPKWAENNYQLFWKVRSELIDSGVLSIGRGRGGSVVYTMQCDNKMSVSNQPAASEEQMEQEIAEQKILLKSETDLYVPICGVLKESWIPDKNYNFSIVEITAKQGARGTGGKWTRPDIVIVAGRQYPCIPGKFLDVITFEVKPSKAIDITVVYEALAHKRSATKSYAWLDCSDEPDEGLLSEIETEAKRQNVGAVRATDAADYNKWEITVEPDRSEPDPDRLYEFLKSQIKQASESNYEKILNWCR